MSNEELPQAHMIYTEYIEKGLRKELAERLWGTIPGNMGEAYEVIKKVRERYDAPSENLEGFKKALKQQQRSLGILTSKVENNIDNLDRGVVESGQQPMALGGPSLILNKVAYTNSLCGIGSDGFVPVFYNADYDGLQAELLNIRIPSPSPRGLLFTYPADDRLENSPIRLLPNPDERWLRSNIEKIISNYKGLMRGVKQSKQERLSQNLSHIVTVVRSAYYSTTNVSDWAAKTLGTLINLETDLGVPILSPSNMELRPYFQGGYEYLLSEPTRSRFVGASNRAAVLVETSGFRSQIGLRSSDYVPFFLECMNSRCFRTRVELKYSTEGSNAVLRGKCTKCEESYEFSFNSSSPDLTNLIDYISPRVDSRQIIVDSIMPVLAHVGGPGETSYYAEVIPAAQELDIPFPAYLRYTRTFYNTPWNEVMANDLKQRGYDTMLNDALFEALGCWVEARNNDDGEALAKSHIAIRNSIESSYNELLTKMESLQSDVDNIKKKLSTVEDRSPLIRELRAKQNEANTLEQYLSWAYGRFSPERFGQEVSWAWFDLAQVTGLNDLLGVYMRMYNRHTPTSSMYFANT